MGGPGSVSPVSERGADSARSVYEQVLGAEVASLHPQLRRYFGRVPAGFVGRGEGVYAWAGPRHRALWPAFAWLAWRQVLFPERGREVPFTVLNTPAGGGGLAGRREFAFPRVTRVMVDTMSAEPDSDGTMRLVDRLGRRRGLEVELALRVHDGGLRMRSTRLWLRMRLPAPRARVAAPVRVAPVRVVRVPLPRLVTMTLDERAHPHGDGRQCVDVRLRAPLLGDVFRYVGEFRYALVPVGGADDAG